MEQSKITAPIRKGLAAAAEGRVISALKFHEQMAAEPGFTLDGPLGE